MKYHFIGIGGTGMAALAGLLKARGDEVRGSDAGVYPPMSDQLAAMEIPVMEGYRPENLEWAPDRVVVGNVCSKDHVEVAAAEERGLELTSLPATLGEVFLAERAAMVVAGTHGKTTTSSLLTHILMEAGRDPSCFIGGVPVNLGKGWRLGSGAEFVVEGDEYDSAFFDKGSKFLHYRPRYATLTSVELDHVDIFSSMEAVRETFRKFVRLIPEEGLLAVCGTEPEALKIAREHATCRVESYAVITGRPRSGSASDVTDSGDAMVVEEDDHEREPFTWEARALDYLPSGRCSFEVWRQGELFGRFETILAGAYNVGNCLAAIALAHAVGVEASTLSAAITSFAGVKRRQEVRGVAQGVTVVDDYAHHPTSVERTLEGLRRRFPRRRLVAIYEPRSATSRRRTFQREWESCLAHADSVVIGKPFDMSRIPEEERFDADAAALAIHQAGSRAAAIAEVGEIVKHVVDLVRPGDVVVIFSSGMFDGLHQRLLTALGDVVGPALREDQPEIVTLLKELDLDWQDIDRDAYSNFLALKNEHGFVGCVGLEIYGDEAVLRSLAVNKTNRGAGYGWMLADSAINAARSRGVRRLYLVTENASDFFAEKHGFRVVDSSTISARITESTSFQRRDSTKQIAMRLDL